MAKCSTRATLLWQLPRKVMKPGQGVSRPAPGPIQPSSQWIPRAISLGVKRPAREADHSSPSSAEVKNGGDIPLLPIYNHGIVTK
jgi:hypothetical protein